MRLRADLGGLISANWAKPIFAQPLREDAVEAKTLGACPYGSGSE